MAIFGWACLLLLTLSGTLVYLILFTQTFGPFNIDGAPTTRVGRAVTKLAGVAILYWWYTLFQIIPISVTIVP